jgi:alkaline phosphatase D
MTSDKSNSIGRRKFIQYSGATLGGVALSGGVSNFAFSMITLDSARPQLQQGIQIGDVTASKGLIWSRSDRPSRMFVEYSYHENFQQSWTLNGPYALEKSDFTARLDLTGLAPDRDVFLRVGFQDLSNDRVLSEIVTGHFKTAPILRSRDLHFLWGGDTAGQGWGINPDFGGMKIYTSMRNENPDFFIHCGDTIYADGPISETVIAENGAVWRNIVTEEVAKVAESLNEFRGRYKYNMLDDNVRAFNAEVPQIWQWDDHEVVNNWSDAKDLTNDARYTEKNVPLLIARGATAFLEYAPMRPFNAKEQDRVYRRIPYGHLLDLMVIDMRSYRGPNSANNQTETGPETRFLGREQLDWLKASLLSSESVWKVIASDMPIGLIVRDGPQFFENLANGDGVPLGRELEMAELLAFIKKHKIENVVWLTADVHYCAAHYYSPEKAVFKNFEPFWEFVAGPLNAGSFGPGVLDNTFGPEVVFHKFPPVQNMSPFAGLQFYGDVKIDRYSAEMTVSLKDINGQPVFSKLLEPKFRQKWKNS